MFVACIRWILRANSCYWAMFWLEYWTVCRAVLCPIRYFKCRTIHSISRATTVRQAVSNGNCKKTGLEIICCVGNWILFDTYLIFQNLNHPNTTCNSPGQTSDLCISDMETYEEIEPLVLKNAVADSQHILSFKNYRVDNALVYQEGNYDHFMSRWNCETYGPIRNLKKSCLMSEFVSLSMQISVMTWT